MVGPVTYLVNKLLWAGVTVAFWVLMLLAAAAPSSDWRRHG